MRPGSATGVAVGDQGFGDLRLLARTYGTPLVVYSAAVLRSRVEQLLGGLPSDATVAYSVKANPNPGIIRFLASLGLMAEVASGGELSLVLRSGIPASKILFGGPTKGSTGIDLALRSGVFALLVESVNDLRNIDAVARSNGLSVDVMFRVNPPALTSTSELRMAGTPSPFGVDESELRRLIPLCDGVRLKYAGLFLYAGSQHFRAEYVIDNSTYLIGLAESLIADGFSVPRVLDFGGGFGVPEDTSQPELDMAVLKAGLHDACRSRIGELRRLGLHDIVFESGRYLVAPAAVYVATVVDQKESYGRRFAVLDGGINNLGIRQMQYRTFEPKVELLAHSAPTVGDCQITLVGPTCTPIDVVHRDCRLPPVCIGDLIVIRDFGAYTTSYSPIHFCGHPWAAEVLVGLDGVSTVLRRRGTVDESCGVGYAF